MYINKAMVMGNLTRDPEIKSIPAGTKVASFSLATNRTWKDQSGAKREQVEYHNIVVFGKQAEVIAQYCKKGSSLLVEGRLQTRSWDDQSGQKKYRTEILLESFQFGPKGSTTIGSPSGENAAMKASEPQAGQKDDSIDSIEYPDEDINVDDIPF